MSVLPHTYRYLITTPDGINQWDITHDVSNDFNHTDEINTGGGALEIDLSLVVGQRKIETGALLDEDGTALLTENDNRLLVETAQTIDVGAGTTFETGNYVYVTEYYGETSALLDEDGTALLAEDDTKLLAESGALDGRQCFAGYVSQVTEALRPDNSGIKLHALPFSTDLQDTIYEESYGFTTSALGPGGGTAWSLYADANIAQKVVIGQSFLAPATGPLEYVMFGSNHAFAPLYPVVVFTAKLYTGSDPNSISRQLLETATLEFDTRGIAISSYHDHTVYFSNSTILTLNQPYHVEITTSAPYVSNASYPALLRVYDDGYADGQAFYRDGNSSSYTMQPTRDLRFIVFVVTEPRTKETNSNIEPGYSMTYFLNRTIRSGRRIKAAYDITADDATIKWTGSFIPEFTFNSNTLLELLNMLLRGAPIGWFWRYSNRDQHIYFQDSATQRKHTFIIGVHLQGVEVVEDMEGMVNKVYFTGGSDPVDAPPLFKTYPDPESIQKYGVKALHMSDGRVTDEASAALLAGYELATRKDPIKRAEIVVLNGLYDTGRVNVGDRVGFTNSGTTSIDDLELVVVGIRRQRGKAALKLGSKVMTERRKLDDMRQAIQALEVKNNPTSPS